MGATNLSALDDQEFERLSCLLLSKTLGARFERFKRGRDSGVDGRFFADEKSEVILQCKHWARSTIHGLLSSLKNTELPKVAKLKPARYYIATSMELNRADKKKIKEIFSGFVKSESDVFGYEDICDLLSASPEVLREFPSLWLSSAEVIGLIENAAILGRSEFSLSDIREKSFKYVKTSNHSAAIEKLEKLGSVLITGLPGIGKTTLAEQLCLEYVLRDYQLCVLGDSIDEAEKIFRKESKQVFYFDDFLGRNYLEALGRHEDSRIVGFIARVAKDPSKRFILTSRSTVLNQAKVITDQFAITKLDRTELELRVETLGQIDKAYILHKHLWFSDLTAELLEQVLSGKRYREIIDHSNFNPRLIQFITDGQRFSGQKDEFWNYVRQTLDNPSAIWEHVFDSQLDDYSRILLLLVVFNGNSIREDHLRAAFESFKRQAIAQPYRGSQDFFRNSRIVTGSVLNRRLGHQHVATYDLFNPSIADYVLQRVPSDLPVVTALFASLDTQDSLRSLNSLLRGKLIPQNLLPPLLESLISQKLYQTFLPISYRLGLARIAFGVVSATSKESISRFLTTDLAVEEVQDSWGDLSFVFSQSIRAGIAAREDFKRFVPGVEKVEFLDESELDDLVNLYSDLDSATKDQLESSIRDLILSFWEDSISDLVFESDLVSGFYSEDDLESVADAIASIAANQLSEYPFDFLNDDVRRVASRVDASDVIYRNQKSWDREDYREDHPRSVGVGTDAIDDLFAMDIPRSD